MSASINVSIKNKVIKYLPYAIIISFLFFDIFLYLSHSLEMHIFYNSDSLYLPTLYKDIFIDARSYSNWYLTPAPYFFPDMILYFLANFLAPSYYFAIPLFFTLQSLILVYILYKIYSLFFSNQVAIYVASVIFLMTKAYTDTIGHFSLLNAFHYGEFLAGLFIIYFLLKLLYKNEKNLTLLFILTSIFTVASDGLFILHFLIPALVTLFYLWSINLLSLRKLSTLAFCILSSIVLGKLLYSLLVEHEKAYSIRLSINNITDHLNIINTIIIDFFNANNIGSLFIILALISALILLLLRNKFFIKTSLVVDKKILFIAFFNIFLILSSIFILSTFNLTVTTRYMIPIFLLPIIFLPLYLNRFLTKDNIYIKYVNLSIFIFIVIFGTFIYLNKFKAFNLNTSYTTKTIECFDKFIENTSAKNGIAQYWQSKRLSMLNKHGAIIASVNRDLSPFKWIISEEWYKKEYDFAIIDHSQKETFLLDKNKIININGSPTQIIKCGASEILYYHTGLSTIMEFNDGDLFTYKARDLPSQIGKISDTDRKANNNTKSGFLTFGPYMKLKEGNYQFNLSYISSENNTTTVGMWDFGIALPSTYKQLQSGNIGGTNNQNGHLIQNFTVPKEYSDKPIEIRNFYNGIGELTIKSLTITRIK